MRLIDADKIIDSLGNSDMDFAIGAVIDEQPTAFYVDKVVEQLKELKMRYFLHSFPTRRSSDLNRKSVV